MACHRIGDLTLGQARVGTRVRCLIVPDITLWTRVSSYQAFLLPVVGRVYTVRANILTATHCGILLEEIKNPQVNTSFVAGEPFFSYTSFCLTSS